jgi:hypothetical protein
MATYQIPLFSIKWIGKLAAFTQGEIADTRTWSEITLVTSPLVLLCYPYNLQWIKQIWMDQLEFTKFLGRLLFI